MSKKTAKIFLNEMPKSKVQSATVIESYESENDVELSVDEGDMVSVINSKSDWWYVMDSEGRKGYVKSAILKLVGREMALPNVKPLVKKLPKKYEERKESDESVNDTDESEESECVSDSESKSDSESDSESEKEIKQIPAVKAKKPILIKKESKKANVNTPKKKASAKKVNAELFEFSDEEKVAKIKDVKKKLPRKAVFDCNVCGDTQSIMDISSIGCKHQFCLDCIRHYIKSRIEDEQTQDFVCPVPDCGRVVDQATVESFLDQDDVEKLQELQLGGAAGTPEMFCCPQPDCGKASELLDNCMAMCSVCGFTFCTNCNQAYHGALDCDLSDIQRKFQLNVFLEEEKMKSKARKEAEAKAIKEEAIRKKAEEKALKKIEKENKMAEKVAKKAQKEREKAAEKTRKAEEEKVRAEMERIKAEEERKRANKERKQVEEQRKAVRARDAEVARRKKIEEEQRRGQLVQERLAKLEQKSEQAKQNQEYKKQTHEERKSQMAQLQKQRAEAKARKQAEEAASENAIRSQCKKCPQCRAGIEKSSGCNHMQCKCGAHFCWICLGKLDPNQLQDHYDKGCTFFTEKDLLYSDVVGTRV